ncbi:hypothetical protein [Celerinatantimonas diazotrophica]|uniref:Uncharacterized protein n=1 Tax=Celerinatantimonas diazotrophica TaxID=412034 RepID=A0A4R1J822_9GAMM|nr:hypothetical protein [Celerinatantimonas diazotrophica]TCK46646.1 hypothetical protein EV690_3231 [Celerinatantimonas diazotrophica]CAG9295348.1 hypothetical protein CEDIAZO_00464 [Celerinatantimonas diazotrophica]
MDELIEKGLNLIKCIESTLTAYDIRSSINEKLSWELVGVQGMVEELNAHSSLTYELSPLDLNRDWGAAMVETLPELFAMVFEFRTAYENKKLNQ